MQITSEISERILKVAGFPRANNTLSPPITGASISITRLGTFSGAVLLSSSISIPWRRIYAMSSECIFDVRPANKFGASFASAPKVGFYPLTSRLYMPPVPAAGT